MELEEIMSKLEETVKKMEQEKLSLEESFRFSSEGMQYVREGNEAMDQVEKKIQILMSSTGEPLDEEDEEDE